MNCTVGSLGSVGHVVLKIILMPTTLSLNLIKLIAFVNYHDVYIMRFSPVK